MEYNIEYCVTIRYSDENGAERPATTDEVRDWMLQAAMPWASEKIDARDMEVDVIYDERDYMYDDDE